MSYEDYLNLVKQRHSVRRFTEETVTDLQLEQICEAGHYAMSGGNSQPWEFLIVRDSRKIEALRREYAEHDFVWTYWLEQQRKETYQHPLFSFPPEEMQERAWKATEQLHAPAVICILYDPRRQFGSVLSARADLNDGSKSVLSCSMGHLDMLMQLAASSMGLGSCRVDCNQQEGYRSILGYPEPVNLYCMMPVGYAAAATNHSSRMPVSEMIHWDVYPKDGIDQGDGILKHIEMLRRRAKKPAETE